MGSLVCIDVNEQGRGMPTWAALTACEQSSLYRRHWAEVCLHGLP